MLVLWLAAGILDGSQEVIPVDPVSPGAVGGGSYSQAAAEWESRTKWDRAAKEWLAERLDTPSPRKAKVSTQGGKDGLTRVSAVSADASRAHEPKLSPRMAEPALIPMDSLDKLLRDLQAYQLTEATMLEAAMHAQHRELMVNIAIRAELALQEAEVAWVLMMMGDL